MIELIHFIGSKGITVILRYNHRYDLLHLRWIINEEQHDRNFMTYSAVARQLTHIVSPADKLAFDLAFLDWAKRRGIDITAHGMHAKKTIEKVNKAVII
jgi:hypothetical protein